MPASLQRIDERIRICRKCPELTKYKICVECGEYMPKAVRIMEFECPLKKWDKYITLKDILEGE